MTAVVARALRNPAGPPPDWSEVDLAGVVAAASHHRVFLLLGWLLRDAGTLHEWPALAEAFKQAEQHALSVDCVRQAELATVLHELTAAGVRPVLFKGAAVAHTHYPAPHIRVRADSDLLVSEGEVSALEGVVRRLGYIRPVETSGALVSYQSHYQKTDRYGVTHALDVHWKISNLQALANCLTHAELWNCRVPVVPLGPSAVTIDAPHSLLLALIHRAGHHPGSRNLLWMYDLHLLDSRLTADEHQQFQAIVAERRLTASRPKAWQSRAGYSGIPHSTRPSTRHTRRPQTATVSFARGLRPRYCVSISRRSPTGGREAACFASTCCPRRTTCERSTACGPTPCFPLCTSGVFFTACRNGFVVPPPTSNALTVERPMECDGRQDGEQQCRWPVREGPFPRRSARRPRQVRSTAPARTQ